MPARRRFDDSCNPPATGPLATATWSPSARRWSVRLTADGTRFVADFLTASPNEPCRRFKRRWPSVHAAAVAAGLSDDDIAEACEAAVIRAAETFDPARGVPFAGYLTTWLRGAVAQAVRRWSRHHGCGVRVVSGTADRADELRPLFDDLADDPRRSAPSSAEDRCDRGTVAAAVRSAVSMVLDATAALVVTAVFGLDGGGERSVAEVASALGRPAVAVRRMVDESLSRMARHLGHLAA